MSRDLKERPNLDPLFEIAMDVLVDAVKDTLYLVPFLFVTYVVMEWIEHRASEKFLNAIQSEGFVGPVIGAVVGVVPQCGFSAAASTLYAARVITIGTLIAVYLSTSDEMLPIFIASQVPATTIAAILGAKVLVGMAAGVAIDLTLRLTHHRREAMRIHELCERANCHCEDCIEGECDDDAPVVDSARADASQAAAAYEARTVDEADAHDSDAPEAHEEHHHDDHHRGIMPLVRSAARHTVEVTVFVFVVVLVLNGVLAGVGEEALASMISAHPMRSVLATALVGLIPNCAASVTIAQLYVDGFINAGAMMAGLLSAAGVGLLVLFRTNTSTKRNFAILGMLWVIAVCAGLLINIAGIAF